MVGKFYTILKHCAVLIAIAAITQTVGVDTIFAQKSEKNMPEYKEFMARLIGTRDSWPDDMTEDESRIMQEHFYYLRDLTKDKKVLMAGPVFKFKIGLIVLRVSSENEAHEILKNDPSVKNGLHTYELSEMRTSLMAHNIPPFRYDDEVIDKNLHKEVVVPGTLDQVWEIWTTTAGLRTFFSPNSRIDLRIGGVFEIQFDMSAPYGKRGSEDCLILSYLPKRMLSYEWNAPPSLGKMRGIRSHVVILFEEAEQGKIRIDFNHCGWGEGEDWQKVYDYFDRAWSYVLGNFEKRMNNGPLNWE